MRTWGLVFVVLAAVCGVTSMMRAASQKDRGLVAYYPFDEGAGSIVHDRWSDKRLVLAVNTGTQIGGTAMEKWTLPKTAHIAGAKVLNNLVVELLNVTRFPSRPSAEWTFTNPRDGWVLIRSTAKVKGTGKVQIALTLSPSPTDAGAGTQGTKDNNAPLPQPGRGKRGNDRPVGGQEEAPEGEGTPLLVHIPSDAATQEAMRFLPAGKHKVKMQRDGQTTVESLIVRAIPELIYCKFPSNPHVSPHGPYDWQFLQNHILPHVNCVVGAGDAEHQPFIKEWKRQGRKWMVEIYAAPYFQGMSADEAYRYWTENVGLKNPLLDGIIADEFGGGDDQRYPAITESVRRIRQNEQFRGKAFYPYCGSMYGAKLSEEFIKTVIASHYRFAWERYLREQPTEAVARKHLESTLTQEMLLWQKAVPGCEEHMIVCFGYLCAPPESLNVNPQVDYKVWMDMQFHHLANDPAFFGLYGLMEYTSSYAEEEAVRWAAKLYRHYGIEGKTDMLSRQYGFTYRLDHLENPDFEDGAKGWTIEAAEPGSVDTKSMAGLSWLQGRYPRTRQGDTFLSTRRSANKPNVFSQEIMRLKPDRLYSLKTFTADYRDLSEGKSVEQKHAVSIQLEGVELIPHKCFQHVFPNCYSHHLGPFNDKHRAWMNYHVRVFRAKGRTAKLSLSDWASETEPGGPIGQELMFNFIEVQPYLEE